MKQNTLEMCAMNESPTARWQVGPFAMVATNWPPDWYAYAEKNYHRVSVDRGLEALDVAVFADDPNAMLSTTIVDSMSITRKSDSEFEIRAGDAVTAQLDLEKRRLRLQLLCSGQSPHILLSNVLRGMMSIELPLKFDGLMFHASSGILDGHGVFFPGISTAGKTTLALGFENVTYLSDDITLTRNLATHPTLSASPFFGVAGRKGANAEAPLAAVGILVRKNPDKTVITRMSKKDALRELMRHAICWSNDDGLHAAILSNVHSLVQQVPVFAVERYIGDTSDVVMEQVLRAANVR